MDPKRIEAASEGELRAPRADYRVECFYRRPGCLGVMHEGAPGAPVSRGLCVVCRDVLKAEYAAGRHRGDIR
jgi:hypothetical protein